MQTCDRKTPVAPFTRYRLEALEGLRSATLVSRGRGKNTSYYLVGDTPLGRSLLKRRPKIVEPSRVPPEHHSFPVELYDVQQERHCRLKNVGAFVTLSIGEPLHIQHDGTEVWIMSSGKKLHPGDYLTNVKERIADFQERGKLVCVLTKMRKNDFPLYFITPKDWTEDMIVESMHFNDFGGTPKMAQDRFFDQKFRTVVTINTPNDVLSKDHYDDLPYCFGEFDDFYNSIDLTVEEAAKVLSGHVPAVDVIDGERVVVIKEAYQ